jgi:uncharacterized protein YecT (DUF1311 family)
MDARAQSLPTASEFQSLLTTCAQGSQLQIDADIIGSATSVYEGERTSGNASLSSQTKFLELFPPEDRLEALRLYNECIVQFLGRSQPDRQGSIAPGRFTPQPFQPQPTVMQPRIEAGFPCERASTPTERLICSDAKLADADRSLNSEFRSLLNVAKRSGFGEDLRHSQRSWIFYRDSVCPVHEQTLMMESDRYAAIYCLLRETSDRTAILASGRF